jgi:adenylate cyclase
LKKGPPRVALLFSGDSMAKEIERKFLVTDHHWKSKVEVKKVIHITQGYLFAEKSLQARIRIANDKGYLTVKGPNKGFVRDEFEYEIPLKDAEALMRMCTKSLMKIRYEVVDEFKQPWEVDQYTGIHAKLITAERELKTAKEQIKVPSWIFKEITNMRKYSNAVLAAQKKKKASK